MFTKSTCVKAPVAAIFVWRSVVEAAPNTATFGGVRPERPPPALPFPGGAGTHVPTPQTRPAGHGAPHAPQWKLLSERFTHEVPQADCPGRHPHALPAQTWVAEQALPHAPQFAASFAVLTQKPLQRVPLQPPDPWHVPAEQNSPAAHALPHPPQFAGSTSISTQTAPHFVL